MRWVVISCVAAAGCQFTADFRDTHYACGAVAPACPASQQCVGGVCVEPFDAARAVADARGDADAVAADASPDAAIPPGLVAVADTTLDAGAASYNYGAAPTLDIRNGAPRANAVLRFDLSAIPPGHVVTRATLHLQVPPAGDDDEVVAIYRLLEPWQEGAQDGATGTASWRERRDGVAWTGAGASGGARGAAPMGMIDAHGAGTYAIELDVATIQGWVTSSANNAGLVLTGVSGSALRLVSREGDLAGRPRLELAFAP
jgi:hypothetical protein